MNSRPLLTAGVDEAGRGPLAGPVVVAAVILDPARPIRGLADSKKLGEARRESLALAIRAQALAFSVCFVEADEIDRLNILQASLTGMARAIAALQPLPLLALVGRTGGPHARPCARGAVGGRAASDPAIRAPPILAKPAREPRMREPDALQPGSGSARHKGYPTPAHVDALRQLGPCREHR